MPVCLPADDRRPRVEGVYHVTIELLRRRRPVLLLTSSGGDGDDVGGGGNGVVVDRRTRVELTTKPRDGARAGYRFLYNSFPRPHAHGSVTLILSGRRDDVVSLFFSQRPNQFWGLWRYALRWRCTLSSSRLIAFLIINNNLNYIFLNYLYCTVKYYIFK